MANAKKEAKARPKKWPREKVAAKKNVENPTLLNIKVPAGFSLSGHRQSHHRAGSSRKLEQECRTEPGSITSNPLMHTTNVYARHIGMESAPAEASKGT